MGTLRARLGPQQVNLPCASASPVRWAPPPQILIQWFGLESGYHFLAGEGVRGELSFLYFILERDHVIFFFFR